ncbi:MAG: hypothetical protein EBX41_00610, partial [Chitinophagia bacterium]|nr:hypothetical protein [Chitinophagia bacterium]
GCIADKVIFETLERHNLTFYQNNHNELEEMIITCLKIKNNIALQDVNDKGIRHILNFGHTTGHAIEAEYGLPHGKAVAIGMAIATHISDHVFNHREPLSERVCKLIEQYELPIRYPYNKQAILQKMQMDKKKIRHSIDFVLLRNIGVAERVPLSIENLSDYLTLL